MTRKKQTRTHTAWARLRPMQSEVARRAGMSVETIRQYLRCTGRPGCPARHNPAYQLRIAQAMGRTAQEVFGAHAAKGEKKEAAA